MKNPSLEKAVEPENEVKNFLVEHTGDKLSPDNMEVTLEMIIEVLSSDFPELVLALAEENWIRGYQQGLDDVYVGREMLENEKQNNKPH